MNSNLLNKPSALKNIKKNNPQIKEASTFAINSLYFQQNGDYDKSKNLMQQAIEKLRQVIVNDPSVDKEKILTYYSLFEKFLNNINSQQENEKNENEKSSNLNFKFDNKKKLNNSENLKNVIDLYLSLNDLTDTEKLFNLTNQICSFLGKAIESGFYFSKDIFFRKEIFSQENAKIEQINHKFETHKTIYKRLDDLSLLARKKVITYENLSDFCDYIHQVQNNLSHEIPNIQPSKYSKNDSSASTFVLFKTFNEISEKLKNNMIDNKLKSIPNYFIELTDLFNHFKDFELILDYKLYKNDSARVKQKKREICDFFYHTIIFWTLNDMKSIAGRFLKKKLMNFEQYYQ